MHTGKKLSKPGWDKPYLGALAQICANAAILASWLWLFRAVYPYLGTIFTRQEFRTNQVVLLAALALIIMQVRRGDLRLQPASRPRPYMPALAMALGGAAGFILAERNLDINTLSATLFGLATYGLVGLWMNPTSWRGGLPAALLLVGTLPFGEHMQTFIGYPLRIATARLVSAGMAALGYPNLGVDTILVFENGISQVDNPCSGVKSLWTGALFFLAATWIERRPVNRRWLLAAIGFALLLVAANLGRVALLVAFGQALDQRLLAEMLHVPLGVIGFSAACGAALLMLRWAGPTAPLDTPDGAPVALAALPSRGAAWLAPLLILVLAGLGSLVAPLPSPAEASTPLQWHLPSGLSTEAWPLTSGELDWLTDDGASLGNVTGNRWRIEWRGLSGSLLIVSSSDWRAHHRPERCFTVYGLQVQTSMPELVEPDFPVRLLELGIERGQPVYSAAYWLQSSSQVTDDYAARIWDDLAPQPETWVLVTVLFDEPVDMQAPDTQELFSALRESIDASLEGD